MDNFTFHNCIYDHCLVLLVCSFVCLIVWHNFGSLYFHDIKNQITRWPPTSFFKFLLSWPSTPNYQMTTHFYFQVLTFMTSNTKLPDDQPLIFSSSYLDDTKYQITRWPTTSIFKFLLSWPKTPNYQMTNHSYFQVLTWMTLNTKLPDDQPLLFEVLSFLA